MTAFKGTGSDTTYMDGGAPVSELIDKYLAGECNAGERAAVESWYETRRDVDSEAAITELYNALADEVSVHTQDLAPSSAEVAECADDILATHRELPHKGR